nr:hypothetical protein CFP56_07586 [Quercus suber]
MGFGVQRHDLDAATEDPHGGSQGMMLYGTSFQEDGSSQDAIQYSTQVAGMWHAMSMHQSSKRHRQLEAFLSLRCRAHKTRSLVKATCKNSRTLSRLDHSSSSDSSSHHRKLVSPPTRGQLSGHSSEGALVWTGPLRGQSASERRSAAASGSLAFRSQQSFRACESLSSIRPIDISFVS